MAEKISELNGEAREQRIAELKAKMQAAAARAKANYEATGSPTGEAAAAPAAPAAVASAAPVAAAPVQEAAPVQAAVAPARPAPGSAPSGNGAAAPRPAPPRPKPAAEADANVPTTAEMNRREFLIYTWGAALGLLTLQTGVLSYFFLYPRFREGEFGGLFFVPESLLPSATSAPEPNVDGRFWLVTTEEGDPRAIYMVCTHLGCLYKWEPSTFQFECPCHGSKFTVDGHYIEGPADRSLDEFVIEIVHNGEVVSQTQETAAAIVPPTVPDSNAEIVVDTGRRILGRSAATSPARAG